MDLWIFSRDVRQKCLLWFFKEFSGTHLDVVGFAKNPKQPIEGILANPTTVF
jgi:hypothetical protein